MPDERSAFYRFGEGTQGSLARFAGLASLDWSRHAVTPKGPWLLPAGLDEEQARKARALAHRLGLADAAWLRQVHGGEVLRAEISGCRGEADVLVCSRPGLGILVRGADCPLILAAAEGPRGRAVGAAHASWRGTVAGAARNMAAALLDLSGAEPAALRAAIAPSAGPCCYEVGEEVRGAALGALGPKAATWFPTVSGRLHFDLWAANRAQLEAMGVPTERVESSGECTICGNRSWPSWRAEGAAAGRIAAIIGILEMDETGRTRSR